MSRFMIFCWNLNRLIGEFIKIFSPHSSGGGKHFEALSKNLSTARRFFKLFRHLTLWIGTARTGDKEQIEQMRRYLNLFVSVGNKRHCQKKRMHLTKAGLFLQTICLVSLVSWNSKTPRTACHLDGNCRFMKHFEDLADAKEEKSGPLAAPSAAAGLLKMVDLAPNSDFS